MADHGAQLQTYNNELVKYLESLREKQAELLQTIKAQEDERTVVQGKIGQLEDQLRRLNEGLNKKYAAMAEYDKTINQTEAAFIKIVETSQSLVERLKRDTQVLGKHV